MPKSKLLFRMVLPILAVFISSAFAAIQSTCVTNGEVALTFDLGPGPHTGKLLDELFVHRIPAAFHFSTALFRNLTLTEYVRRAHIEGHTLGIFISETVPWTEAEEMPEDDAVFAAHVVQQIITASNWIASVTGSVPRYVRFSGKPQLPVRLRKTIEQQLGFTITSPKVDIRDDDNDLNLIWDSLLKGFFRATPQSNSFILGRQETMADFVSSVEQIVEYVRGKGFQIVPLTRCVPPRQSR